MSEYWNRRGLLGLLPIVWINHKTGMMMSKWDDIDGYGRPIVEGLEADLLHEQQVNASLSATLDGTQQELADALSQIEELRRRMPLKPGLRGLITTDPSYVANNIPYAEFASKKLNLRDLYPSPGVFNFTPVNNLLANYPNLKFRLRFMAGINCPDWMKARSGGAIQHNPSTGTGGTGLVPRFWTDEFYQDYMEFMQAVADKYESNPQVVEVTNSLTTTVYAEPFILNADAATIDRYWQAGYRKDLVKTSLVGSMHEMMELFPTTRVSLAGHGKWEHIVQGTGPDDGKFAASWEEERAIFNDLIDLYGPHLVLDDHGLDDGDALGTPQPRDTATTWYNYMAGLEDSKQTYGWQFTMKEGSNMTTAADMGVTMGACFEELAAFNAIEPVKRRQIHDALVANGVGKP